MGLWQKIFGKPQREDSTAADEPQNLLLAEAIMMCGDQSSLLVEAITMCGDLPERSEYESRPVKCVKHGAIVAEPTAQLVLPQDMFMNGSVQISPPEGLLERADEAMKMNGEVLALGHLTLHKFPAFADDESRSRVFEGVCRAWSIHLKIGAKYWRAYHEVGGMGIRYTVLVLFDEEVAFMKKSGDLPSIQLSTAKDEPEWREAEAEAKRREAEEAKRREAEADARIGANPRAEESHAKRRAGMPNQINDLNDKLFEAIDTYRFKEDDAVPVIQKLLDAGADIDARDEEEDGQTPLMQAAVWGCPKLVKLLIENGANTALREKNGRTVLGAFEHATRNGCGQDELKVYDILVRNTEDGKAWLQTTEGAAYLRLHTVDKSSPLQTTSAAATDLLRRAIREGSGEEYQEILRWVAAGEDLSWRTPNGWTLLHLAAQVGNEKLVRLLADRGTNLEARDTRGATALMLACDTAYAETRLTPAVVKALLDVGADANALDNKGTTAAQYLVSRSPDAKQIGEILESTVRSPKETNRAHNAVSSATRPSVDDRARQLMSLWRSTEIDFFWPKPGKGMSCEECSRRYSPIENGFHCSSCGRRIVSSDYLIVNGDHYKHKAAIDIGKVLHVEGGAAAMEAVAHSFVAFGGRMSDLSRCWDGTGDWRH